jgi:hypothetical protein
LQEVALVWFLQYVNVDLKLIVAFMYLLPIGFEIFSEQSRILAKIQMQMATDTMMGPGADMQPTIRPF